MFVKTSVSTKLAFHITVNKHLGQKEKHKLEDLNTDGGDGVDHDKTILGDRNLRNFVLNMEEWKKREETQGSCRAPKPMMTK
jgi:hypothetical protein